MFKAKHLSDDEADQAKDQYEAFVNDEARKFDEDFIAFNKSEDRLDKFFGKWLHRNPKYADLWKVMIFIFTLSHGQAQVERGFNINSEILVENLSSRSLIAQRMVYDHVTSSGSSEHDFVIDPELRVSCINAHSKYKEYLKKNKLEKQKTREDEKVEELLSEIQTLNRKQLTIRKTIATLQKDANDCYDKAEQYNDDLQKMQNEVSKGNGLRQTIGQKRKQEKNTRKTLKL